MANNLYEVNPEKVREWLAQKSESLGTRLGNFQKTPAGDFVRISKHAFHLMSINQDLAGYHHLLGESAASISARLMAAAHWFVVMLDAKAKGALHGNSVWTLHLGNVGLVTAFGAPAERAALSGVALDVCVSDGERTSVAARATALWHEVLGTGVLAERAAQSALTDCEAESADRWEREWIHGILRALLGISRQNAKELNAGLDEVLAFHRYLATRGGWEVQVDGILSLAALGLMRLALEAGLPVTVSSSYAPLALLQVERA